MKYYSEELNKTFNTEKECIQAEKEFKQKKELEEKEKQIKEANISKQKKELSKAIELAQEKVKQANTDLEIAKNRCAEILEESNKEVRDILEEAEHNLKLAQEEKLNALAKFNKQFGAYKVILNSDDLTEDINKSVGKFNDILTNFIDSLFI